MYPIQLTQRTIAHRWNRDTQEEETVTTDEVVYVNPELIECVEVCGDAPHKYATHIRTQSHWSLFVVESPEEVVDAIKAARYSVYLEQALGKTP